jgi:hypothetical protein
VLPYYHEILYDWLAVESGVLLDLPDNDLEYFQSLALLLQLGMAVSNCLTKLLEGLSNVICVNRDLENGGGSC